MPLKLILGISYRLYCIVSIWTKYSFTKVYLQCKMGNIIENGVDYMEENNLNSTKNRNNSKNYYADSQKKYNAKNKIYSIKFLGSSELEHGIDVVLITMYDGYWHQIMCNYKYEQTMNKIWINNE